MRIPVPLVIAILLGLVGCATAGGSAPESDAAVPASPAAGQPAAEPAIPRGPAATAVPMQAHRAFLAHLLPYCGYAYRGRSVMVDLGEDNPLEGASLLMNLEVCTEKEVRIPFHVDEDRSRTWILRLTERGLHLSHDHRHPDGREYDQNFYGGYADARGTATRQLFPADERTIQDRPAREINVWEKELDVQNRRYYYRLYLRGELRYEAEFDLSDPLPLAGRPRPGSEAVRK